MFICGFIKWLLTWRGLAVALLFTLGACRIFRIRDLENIQYSIKSKTFTTEYNRLFTVKYSDDGQYILLSLNGVQHELKRAISASGARYANKDGSIVFWSKAFQGNHEEAFIEINGEIVLRHAAIIGE